VATPIPEQAAAAEARPSPGEPSLGDLIGEITNDFSQLVRDELELAKAEIKQESTRAAKGVGMLAGSGYAGHLTLLLGSLTIVFALAHFIDLAWAALVVTAVWAVVGGGLYTVGRRRLRETRLKPERTVEELKEDAAWARHPTS